MKSQKGIIHLGLILVLLVVGIGALGYVMYKTNSLPVVTTSSPTPTTLASTSPSPQTTMSDEGMSDWETYTNTVYKYEMSYPSDWQSIVNPITEGREFSLKSSFGEYVNIVAFTSAADASTDNQHKKTFSIPSGGSILVTYVECNGPGCGNGKRDLATFQKMLSTFEFVNTGIPATQETGANLSAIKYTLPDTWTAELSSDTLLLTANGGGYLSIKVYDYSGIGRREYFCKVTGDICTSDSYFTAMQIGNISGYRADALDNSGGGSVYFGTKGDKFYIINSYSPPAPNEFQNTYQQVLNSLIF